MTYYSLDDAFQSGLELSQDGPCFGLRYIHVTLVTPLQYIGHRVFSSPYTWQTYAQISLKRIEFGCGIVKLAKDLGISPDLRWFLGIYCNLDFF